MAQPMPSSDHLASIAPLANPFATAEQQASNVPTYPKPVAHLPSQQFIAAVIQPSNGNERPRPQAADSAYKSDSVSTTADSFTITPISSGDEKRCLAREPKPQPYRSSKHKRSSRDPEKAEAYNSGRGSRDRQQRVSTTYEEYAGDHDEDARKLQEEKAVRILLFLSFPCVILSSLNAIWALLSLLITISTQPVRICARRPSFGQQLGGLLGPALNLQLKSIYTPLPPHADEDFSYHSTTLVLVQFLSPFLSLGIMLAAWVVAVFWFASAMVGDPSGIDKRDDGRETVLALRGWWEKWLSRSLREI